MSSSVLEVDSVVESPAVVDGSAAPASPSSLRSEAGVLSRALAAFVGRVDSAAASGSLDGGEAAAVASLLAGVERLASAGKTLAAGRVAATGQYRALGFPTAGRWLAEVSSDGARAAGRVIATAAYLDDPKLAATRSALVDGSLTAAQAEEIACTAASAPSEETRLLGLARRETTKRLREECRRVRLAGRPGEDPKARRERMAKEMAFGARDLGNGMGELFARMPSTALVLMMAAVRSQCEAIFERARRDGRSDPQAAYMVEALVTLMLFGDVTGTGGGGGESAAADASDSDDVGQGNDADDVEGPADGRELGSDDARAVVRDDGSDDDGDDGDGAAAGTGFDDPLYRELIESIWGGGPLVPPPRGVRRRVRRGRCSCGGRVVPRAKIIVRVDQSALVRGWTEGDETCEIAGVGPVPVATVRDLWPDAVVKLVVTKGVDVVNVTHLGRRATEEMATAMQWESARCSNLACDNDQFVEVDHRLGWANVHRTRVDELDGLFPSCHSLKTNEDWQLVRGRGRRRFVPPEDPDHPGDPPTPRRRA